MTGTNDVVVALDWIYINLAIKVHVIWDAYFPNFTDSGNPIQLDKGLLSTCFVSGIAPITQEKSVNKEINTPTLME